jgi:hypothetical protein
MRVTRVTPDEFELENGDVHPIVPPLKEVMTPDEFQEHYDRALAIVQSVQDARGDSQDVAKVARRRKG